MTGDMTPSWLVWVFNSYASLAILFIILVLFCFVFEHETINTALVLAVFDFYYRTYACNLTECENLQNSDCPFPLLFEDFRLCSRYNNVNYGTWHVYKPLFGSSNAICRLDCSEISLSKKKKNMEKSPGYGTIRQMAWQLELGSMFYIYIYYLPAGRSVWWKTVTSVFTVFHHTDRPLAGK